MKKKKKKWNRIIIPIVAKKVYNGLICRIGVGFAEHYESLAIKSHTSNHIEIAY